MSMKKFHQAAKAVECGGVEGFCEAAIAVGAEAAFALVVAHLRRKEGSTGAWPADPDIIPKVNGILSQNLRPVYSAFSAKAALFCPKKWDCLDNFSAYAVTYQNRYYPTAEHAFQSMKFLHGESLLPIERPGDEKPIAEIIRTASSAHEANCIGHSREYAPYIRADWNNVQFSIMESILRAKCQQHAYVRKVLFDSRGMLLVKDSSSDPFWGRGFLWDGKNMLGKLWMRIRDERRD